MTNAIFSKKVNYAKDVFMDGCDAPLTVWFEAAAPAALHASLSWYCLDPVQMFTGYVRPVGPLKGKRGGGHGRGSKSKGKKSRGWAAFKRGFGFDPSEWAAKQMPFQQDLAGRSVSNGVNYMWAGFGQLERFNNIMFMYTVTETFFWEIALGVANSEYCQNQRASSFLGHSTRQGHFSLAGTSACVIEEIVKSRNISYAAGNGVGVNAPRCTAMFSCGSWISWDGETDPFDSGIMIITGDGPPVRAPLPKGGGPVAVSAYTREGGFVAFELYGNINFWVYDIQFLVFGKSVEPDNYPEGWCNKLADKAINWATGGT